MEKILDHTKFARCTGELINYELHYIPFQLFACISGLKEAEMVSNEELFLTKIIHLGQGEGFSCVDCDYISNQRSNIRNHVEMKHLNLLYTCNICSKTKKSYKAWYEHVKLHK